MPTAYSNGQCAMCRATVESNVNETSASQGQSVGAGLNTGILYLMSIPYILLSVLGFVWYRESKKNKKQKEKNLEILRKRL